jgi:hypothetical protein
MTGFTKSISDFNKALKIDWGRIDFMGSIDELIFLEFNANGQWVFLDLSGDDGLVKIVSDYLMPNRREELEQLTS